MLSSNPQHNATFSELDFSSFKKKVKSTYGLDLEAYKRPQMERRLRANMERCGASTFTEYYALMQNNETLRDEFLDRVTINVSELFRNPEQFETLRTRVLPKLLARNSALSVWSAGCSYGAEPYTLAILLDEMSATGRHKILATDIDDKMLARARQGIFQEHEVRNVTRPRLVRYFDRQDYEYVAKDSIRSRIEFRKHNLLEGRFGLNYDLILCRNVVIYFTEETKAALYRRFYASLKPGGFLFVGGTERISDCAEIGFENPIPFFYKKPESQ